MNNIIKKTNGKKTEFVLILGLLFELFLYFYPATLPVGAISTITWILNSSVFATLVHRIGRNRVKIWKYIKDKFKGLKKAKNAQE